jgi:putative endonuclease
VLARNWRCADGELDLVVMDGTGATVVICEVKTRLSDRFGSPFDAVAAVKQRKLRRLAGRWLAERRASGLPGALAVRFDVAGVTTDGRGRLQVEVIENAFG